MTAISYDKENGVTVDSFASTEQLTEKKKRKEFNGVTRLSFYWPALVMPWGWEMFGGSLTWHKRTVEVCAFSFFNISHYFFLPELKKVYYYEFCIFFYNSFSTRHVHYKGKFQHC